MSNIIGPQTKHRLFIAQQVTIYVVLPTLAVGFYLGSQYSSQAQAKTDQIVQQAVKAAVATPAPSK